MINKANKRILAVVVTYNPDIDLLRKNLDAFSEYVDQIILWRNSFLDISFPKVILEGDCTNQGIAKALNFAAEYAEKEGYDYLLTMDQDSVWNDFPGYLSLALANNAPQGLYGPRLEDVSQDDYVRTLNLITSGMLIPIPLLKRIGGWRTDFFVDCLDVDLVLHAETLGIHSYKLGAGSLTHRLGNRRRVHNLFYTYDYSPERLYFIFRNHIQLFREYGATARPLKRLFIKRWVFHRIPRIVLGEKNVWTKLKAIFKGVRDGLSNKNDKQITK